MALDLSAASIAVTCWNTLSENLTVSKSSLPKDWISCTPDRLS